MSEKMDRTEGTATERDATTQRRAVRNRYANIATATETGCGSDGGCCDGEPATAGSERLGYSADEMESVATGADLGLGCGNPTALASLDAGETVLDLGSGAGFDCFLAAQAVGETGRVIGVDMTAEMVEKARDNVAKNGATNVEFRLGEIEHLPVADETVDVIISNCVINLSPEKSQMFREAFRVLKPGGRLAISDVVMTASVPESVRGNPESVAACISGASTVDDLIAMLAETGFETVEITPKGESAEFIGEWDDTLDLSDYIVSATITGEKPESDTDSLA
ncbi:arsenite methyltransferase [Haladaptatus sp. DJG-WS-42]|uniref:arsenite methyltransferase n=1 Tax=Haladaptatus sp. DJG-WS-42 TaxID=3120516 RepID=UPI0030CDC146